MERNLCPMDELITADLEGFLDAPEDAEEEVFDLNGKRVN